MLLSSTICAVATPAGEGAIAIIRISGQDAFSIVNRLFRPIKNAHSLDDFASHSVHFGNIIDGNHILDEVLITVFRAPHSYTGEDAVEISCHGSTYIQKRLIELLLEAGATLAQPGEFTLRAVLNGKLDVAQAEGVGDLIASKSKASTQLAMLQLKGELSKTIKTLREKLIRFLSLLELELDFGEEDVEFANREELLQLANETAQYVNNLLHSFGLGNAIKNGIPTAIVGEPNVGKSTLLNLLLQEEKAIVTDIPGTTRDVIEDMLTINGFLFRLMDTAGIRQTNDTIEVIGIEKTFSSVAKAALVLYLSDASQSQKKFVKSFLDLKNKNPQAHYLVLLNKIDQLSATTTISDLEAEWQEAGVTVLALSAKDKHYRSLLQDTMIAVSGLKDIENELLISNVRHYEALKRVSESMTAIQDGLKNRIPEDLLTQDIKQAMYYLGLIAGEITPDDVLQSIFKNFCIGK